MKKIIDLLEAPLGYSVLTSSSTLVTDSYVMILQRLVFTTMKMDQSLGGKVDPDIITSVARAASARNVSLPHSIQTDLEAFLDNVELTITKAPGFRRDITVYGKKLSDGAIENIYKESGGRWGWGNSVFVPQKTELANSLRVEIKEGWLVQYVTASGALQQKIISSSTMEQSVRNQSENKELKNITYAILRAGFYQTLKISPADVETAFLSPEQRTEFLNAVFSSEIERSDAVGEIKKGVISLLPCANTNNYCFIRIKWPSDSITIELDAI